MRNKTEWHAPLSTRSYNTLLTASEWFRFDLDDARSVRGFLRDPQQFKKVRGVGKKVLDEVYQALEIDPLNPAPRTCDQCKHWCEVNPNDDPEPMGMCRQIAINHWQPGYSYDSSKIWEADEDPEWGVGTGPKFGCVHWEAIPE